MFGVDSFAADGADDADFLIFHPQIQAVKNTPSEPASARRREAEVDFGA